MKVRGFTILEILVVLAVVAILVAIAVPRIKGLQDQANIQKAQSGLKTLESAITTYYMHHGAYPPVSDTMSADSLVTDIPQILDSALYDPFGADSTTEYKYLRSQNGGFWAGCSAGLGADHLVTSVAPLANGSFTVADDDICVTSGMIGGAAPAPDPCAGKNPGDLAEGGDGALCAGSNYMVTPSDAGPMVWSDVYEETAVTDPSDGAGNTDTLAAKGPGYAAAYYCKNTERTGEYTNWYLPAKDELNALYANADALGMSVYYWSSTEGNNEYAYGQHFNNNGDQYVSAKDLYDEENGPRVRCVRRY